MAKKALDMVLWEGIVNSILHINGVYKQIVAELTFAPSERTCYTSPQPHLSDARR
jgi:hypothetical protein